ncbi:hypothetical protein ACNOYE_14000 [Nannocystaceae bacterium ST9]
MRRLSATLPAFSAAFVLLAAPACKDKPSTNVSIAPDDEGEAAGRGEGSELGPTPPRGPVEKIQLHGSASGIADMLAAGTKLIEIWNPPEPGSPAIDLRTLVSMTLIQQGFGPGFFDSLKLDEVHAFEFAYPQDGQPGTTAADIELALALSASDPVRAIESLPASMQPQPLGNNLWQMPVDDLQVFLRASADAVEVALAMEQLDRAAGLRQKVPAGPRLRLGASNIPAGDIDVGELLPVPGSDVLTSVLNDTTAVELLADFGSDRDLSGRLDVVAPFQRLGLDPIGPASQAPSELAQVLPGDAMFAWVMPWGNPKLLHGMLDRQIPLNQIPAPFDGYVGDVLRGSHGVLDQIKDEVLSAAYLDGKQQLTLVMAAEVKDEAAARSAMRGIMQTAQKAFEDHIALVGGKPENKYKVEFKTDAVKVGKAKADSFTLTLSKSMAEDPDIAVFDSLVGRKTPKLEILMVVSEGKLIVTIGAGGRALMADVGRSLGKPGKDSLEAEGGLAKARELTQGCQYCVVIDPLEIGRMILTIQADDPDLNEKARKAAREGSSTLAKLGVEGQLALSLRMENDKGSLGMLVPKSLLFVDPAKAAKILAVFETIEQKKVEATPPVAVARPASP